MAVWMISRTHRLPPELAERLRAEWQRSLFQNESHLIRTIIESLLSLIDRGIVCDMTEAVQLLQSMRVQDNRIWLKPKKAVNDERTLQTRWANTRSGRRLA